MQVYTFGKYTLYTPTKNRENMRIRIDSQISRWCYFA